MKRVIDPTTISLSKKTRDRLKSMIKYGERYDGIINQLLDQLDTTQTELAIVKAEMDNLQKQLKGG